MLQHGTYLFERHAWKPLDELVDGSVIFEVLKSIMGRIIAPGDVQNSRERDPLPPTPYGRMTATG